MTFRSPVTVPPGQWPRPLDWLEVNRLPLEVTQTPPPGKRATGDMLPWIYKPDWWQPNLNPVQGPQLFPSGWYPDCYLGLLSTATTYRPDWWFPNLNPVQGVQALPSGKMSIRRSELPWAYDPSWWMPNLDPVQGIQIFPPGQASGERRMLPWTYDPSWWTPNFKPLQAPQIRPPGKLGTASVLLWPYRYDWWLPNLKPIQAPQIRLPGKFGTASVLPWPYRYDWWQPNLSPLQAPQKRPPGRVGEGIVYPPTRVYDYAFVNPVILSGGAVTYNVNIIEAISALDSFSGFVSPSGSGDRPAVRDWWDRDEWGNWIPGAGYHRG